jgi:hydroxyacylglutathione hydrolase
MDIKTLCVGALKTNCYLIHDPDSESLMIIDPGDDSDYISQMAYSYYPKHIFVIATHGHFDHIMGSFGVTVNFMTPLLIHQNDIFLVKRMTETAKYFLKSQEVDPPPQNILPIDENYQLFFGETQIILFALPGHTPGSIGILFKSEKVLFSGDVIFSDGSVGRTDHEYSSVDDLNNSILQIKKLSKDFMIYPGHGESFIV